MEEKKKTNKEAFYVDPKVFKEEIKIYYESGKCTDYLGNCINKIAEGLGYNPRFLNYSYKEDMVGDAITKMYSALKRKKFDVLSDASPFNYFTTIAFHAFINRIKKEKRHHDTITAYKERKYEELLSTSDGHDDMNVKFGGCLSLQIEK
jgi:hypothetical protein